MYGASEATARMSLIDVVQARGAEQSIGFPVTGGAFELLGSDGTIIEQTGVPGELCFRGPNVMMGYAACREDLARGQTCLKLKTGDIALLREDGLHEIVGRKSRFSKIAGVRLGHDAVEIAMAKRQMECAVIGDDKELMLFHERGSSADHLIAAAQITGLGSTRLKAVQVAELPRLPNGKLDYSALKAESGQTARVRDDLEAVFANSFFPHKVSPTDSFAGLGGDSLKHVEISLGLERCLGHIPAGWETMPVSRLVTLQALSHGKSGSLSTELVIRALAILMVVLQHATLWPVPGGAAAMTVLLGFAMGRFQLPLLTKAQFPVFFRPLLRTLPPYFLLVAGYALAWGQVPWASVFLIGNFGFADPVHHTMLPYLYWFVEAFFQLLLLIGGIFMLPSIRKLGGEHPFRLGLYFLAAALVLRYLSPWIWDIGNRKLFTLPWILPLAAFGWCAAHADTSRRRAILLCLALVFMPLFALQGGNWTGSWFKYSVQFVVIVALAYLPVVSFPARLRRPVLIIAHASFHIYLFHRFVPEVLLSAFEDDLPRIIFTTSAVAGGLLLGIATCSVEKAVVRVMRRLWENRETLCSLQNWSAGRFQTVRSPWETPGR